MFELLCTLLRQSCSWEVERLCCCKKILSLSSFTTHKPRNRSAWPLNYKQLGNMSFLRVFESSKHFNSVVRRRAIGPTSRRGLDFRIRNVGFMRSSSQLNFPLVSYLTLYTFEISRSICEPTLPVSRTTQDVLPIRAINEPLSWRRKLGRLWRMLARFVKLSITLAPVLVFYPILLLTHQRNPEEDAQNIVLKSDEENALVDGFIGWYLRLCLSCVEYSGAAVIKLMQWAGSRPDMFGHDFCAVFSQLQDHTTPHRWKHTEKALRAAYGENWKDKIQLFEILGSGCIGQVYRGEVTSENGEKRKVAVKVLHPNINDDIDADLDIMRLAVKLIYSLPFETFSAFRWLNMEGIVEEFASLLKLQLDLRHEAENLGRFNTNFKDVKEIEFPQVVPGFQPTENVLVESFCDGIPILQFARQHSGDRKMLSEMCLTAIHAVCKMIFLDNFMHGDLHPGNVCVSRDGKRFILFDVGIVNEYNDRDHQIIVDVLAAFIRKQGRRAGRLMIDDSNSRLQALHPDEAAVEEEKYLDKIELLTLRASSKDYFMEHLGAYISYICNAASAHHVMMNPSFITAALAVKVQEGIALALDPSIEIWRVASPIIVESERRRKVAAVSDFIGLSKVIESVFGSEKSTEEVKH